MWACDNLISMAPSINNNHSRVHQIQFSVAFIWNRTGYVSLVMTGMSDFHSHNTF